MTKCVATVEQIGTRHSLNCLVDTQLHLLVKIRDNKDMFMKYKM